MNKTAIILGWIAGWLLIPTWLAAQTTIAGVNFPSVLKTEKGELVINGGGVREKLWIDVYVAALYLLEKNKDPRKIIEADQPMAVRLEIVSSMVNSDNMSEAVREGFEKSTRGNTSPLKDRIDAFIGVFSEPIKQKDVFELVYIPDTGVKIYKNGAYKSVIRGLDFKKALFGIWLGDQPVSTSLKNGMLGN